MSTFSGIEMAKKALAAQQGGLHTTGHNISNVNTEGYSRQRVNFESTSPFPMPSRVMPQIAGQIGTGVEIGTVQRVRDQFLDAQFRTENSSLGYWNTKSGTITRMEQLLNEPSDHGLNTQMDRFYASLEDLHVNPTDSGARSVVAERGLALAETFNHLSRSLNTIKGDLQDQINVSAGNINTLIREIGKLNDQIEKIEPHGMLANDLYDDRDRLIDQLSEHVNIKVSYEKGGGNPLAIAQGRANIELVSKSGEPLGGGIYLIEKDGTRNQIDLGENDELGYTDGYLTSINLVTSINPEGVNILEHIMNSEGSFNALIESHGYVGDDGGKGLYPEMLAELDKMAKAFAEAFNEQHKKGVDLNGDKGKWFFVRMDTDVPFSAGNITVNQDILDDSSLIAATNSDDGGKNGNNALDLAKVFEKPLAGDDGLDGVSVRKFYTALIGKMGVEGQEAKSMKDSTGVLRAQVEHSRMSVSAVSLDEEMSNLIKFQHAYNAAARSMTATDELLDRVINQMGLVGR